MYAAADFGAGVAQGEAGMPGADTMVAGAVLAFIFVGGALIEQKYRPWLFAGLTAALPLPFLAGMLAPNLIGAALLFFLLMAVFAMAAAISGWGYWLARLLMASRAPPRKPE